MKILIRMLGTGLGIGMLPAFPGTCATLIGCFFGWLMKDLAAEFYLMALIVVFPIGAWIAAENEKIFGRKDAPCIVIDEIFAFPLAMFLVPVGWISLILAFVLFRIFDIFKPFPCKRLESLPHGYGVMADDYMAAAYTCLVLHLLLRFIPLGLT